MYIFPRLYETIGGEGKKFIRISNWNLGGGWLWQPVKKLCFGIYIKNGVRFYDSASMFWEI